MAPSRVLTSQRRCGRPSPMCIAHLRSLASEGGSHLCCRSNIIHVLLLCKVLCGPTMMPADNMPAWERHLLSTGCAAGFSAAWQQDCECCGLQMLRRRQPQRPLLVPRLRPVLHQLNPCRACQIGVVQYSGTSSVARPLGAAFCACEQLPDPVAGWAVLRRHHGSQLSERAQQSGCYELPVATDLACSRGGGCFA